MGDKLDNGYISVALSKAEVRYLRNIMFLYHGHANKMSAGQARLANKLTQLLEGLDKEDK